MTGADVYTRALEARCDLLGMLAHDPSRYPFLLESVAHGTPQARYDILFAFPRAVIEADSVSIGDFLPALDAAFEQERIANDKNTTALPFRGGWFLFLGYELARAIEPKLVLRDDPWLPPAFAVRCPAAVIRDHVTGEVTAVAEDPELLAAIAADAARAPYPREVWPGAALAEPLREEDPQRYLAIVERARRYIHDGDVFQANLSRAWEGGLHHGVPAWELYRRLRNTNPAPFAGLALWQDRAIVSSSPERLVCVRHGIVQTRPIAGTRPRSGDEKHDRAYARELMAHPKERAEHVMLIDLERNDLGRIARTGTVRVDELMVLESYAHVHHIVSNVRAELRPDITPAQVIAAVFPGGTITGCPKVRCMEIIAELEEAPRGAYTGSMGYLNRDGDMDLNILIRTLVKAGDRITFRAGAGIVADSVPERELEETRAKARGLVLALQEEAG